MNYRTENSSRCTSCSNIRNTNCSRSYTNGCTDINNPRNTNCQESTNCHRRRVCSNNRSTLNRPCRNSSICTINNGFLDNDTPIAMVYSPVQQWRELYDPHTALTQGTIFKELDLPFYPTPCSNKETRSCRCR